MYMPTTASLWHTFIYGVLPADQRDKWLAATHASSLATMPHKSDTGVSTNTWYNRNNVDISITGVPTASQYSPATRCSSCPIYGVITDQPPYPMSLPQNSFFLYGVLPTLISWIPRPNRPILLPRPAPMQTLKNLLQRHRRHHNHKHDVPADKTCNVLHHSKKCCESFLLLGYVAWMGI